MGKLIRSIPSRNTWRICDKFKVLPDEPKIKNLTVAQREWIIENMELDIKEQQAAAEGKELSAYIEDDGKDYDKDVMQSSDFNKVLEDGPKVSDLYKDAYKDPETKQIIEKGQAKLEAAYRKKIYDKKHSKDIKSEADKKLDNAMKYFNKKADKRLNKGK